MRTMAKETHIKTDKKTYWRLGCLGVAKLTDKCVFGADWALLHKSLAGRASPYPGRT